MKKLIIVIFLFFVLSSVFSEEKEPRFTIQINPLTHLIDIVLLFPIFDDYSRFKLDLEFQYLINQYINISINPRFSYYRKRIFIFNLPYSLVQEHLIGGPYYHTQIELLFTPGILFRPFGTGLEGFYIGGYIPLGWLNSNRDSFSFRTTPHNTIDTIHGYNVNFGLLGIGTSIGYQWGGVSRGFTMSLRGGVEKKWSVL